VRLIRATSIVGIESAFPFFYLLIVANGSPDLRFLDVRQPPTSWKGVFRMKRICAWCNKPLDDEPADGSPITHGICSRCLEYVLINRTAISSFLNTIDAPVLAVDGEARAISANRLALLALNKEHSEIADKLGGEVIECQYSHLPGGCGKTIHCTGCQIRGSVNHTCATGEPRTRVKAYQHIMTPTGVRTFDYYISTEKLGDNTILLRIDEVKETGG
jgi:hypothetical protein